MGITRPIKLMREHGNRGWAGDRKKGRKRDQEITFVEREERRKRILATRARINAKWRSKTADVRRANFENFKNHYYGNGPDFAIEVLVGSPNITDQIRREQNTRRQEEMARLRQEFLAMGRYDYGMAGLGMPMRSAEDMEKRKAKKAEKDATADKDKAGKSEKSDRAAKPEVLPSDAYIHRVRIQSQPVLAYLTRLLGVPEHLSWPRTFVRPFKPLIYFQPQMKKALEDLTKRYGHLENQVQDTKPEPEPSRAIETEEPQNEAAPEDGEARDAEGDNDDGRSDSGDSDDSDDSDLATVVSDDGNQDLLKESVEALRDMRCYVKFVDEEILPMHNRFARGDQRKVAFDDLWSLFRVGELVYMPCTNEATERYQELWRIYRIETPEPDFSYPNDNSGFLAEEEFNNTSKEDFILFCYYIDYDGSAYGAVRHKFHIKSFSGEREIDSLEVYPIRFLASHEQLLASLTQQGREFQRFLKDRHQAYNAWTLTRNPPGDSADPEDEIIANAAMEKVRHPEFVESHVIIDFAEAFQANPDWRPRFHRLSVSKSISCSELVDDLPIQQWTDRSRTTLLYKASEALQRYDGVEMRERRDNLALDLFLKQRTKDTRVYGGGAGADLEALTDEQLALLPRRMFAYSLRERRFVLVDLRFLKPVFHEDSVFDNLKIRSEYKLIVRGLVESHFQRKVLERRLISQAVESRSQDLIQGKGRGLIILLHGVPGVGKTATAEAVASTNRKPLFVITCGDLGLTPDAVESSLNKIFRLAHLWDCVLLLDEADVFLSQRSRLDMKRNALVSVFLRVLEYYNGLLFLTTNRVGTIDEAFKSRIHMFLYYPPLNQVQVKEIFKLNVAKLRQIERQRHEVTGHPEMLILEPDIMKFAEEHIELAKAALPCWNGRQIRNAFQVAAGLAHHRYAQGVLAAEAAEKEGKAAEAAALRPEAPVLDRGLFETVQVATQDFETYMREAKGLDDADIAYMLGERADHVRNRKPPPAASGWPRKDHAEYGNSSASPAPTAGLGGVSGGLAGRMANGMSGGIAGGLANAMSGTMPGNMGGGMAGGLAGGLAGGMHSGVSAGMAGGIPTGPIGGMTGGMAGWGPGSAAGGIAGGMNMGMAGGVANDMAGATGNGIMNGVPAGMASGMSGAMGGGYGFNHYHQGAAVQEGVPASSEATQTAASTAEHHSQFNYGL